MHEFKVFGARFIAVSVLAIGAIFDGANAFALDVTKSPGSNLPNLSRAYVLQDFNAQGTPEEIAIGENLQNAYFYTNCYRSLGCHQGVPEGAVVFNTPSGLNATPNSHYPRVELRAKREFTAGEVFDNAQSGELYVVQNPSTQSIIFAQIHGDKAGGSELLKLRWEDGSIVAGTKTRYGQKEQRTVLLTGLKLNDKLNYKIEVKGSEDGMVLVVSAAANGRQSSREFDISPSSWQGINLYFKAGNYNQTAEQDGGAAIVAYTSLDVSYQ
ncbi:polysaccharide lyase family 7 protein [Pseudomonas sp. Z18(2022)]|uniref:polysaccharide lyase family 7 protein n=1 Tax=Pseudomonas sp. Z18(2022) TaxID=2983410 RepID=UPI002E8031A6|nr:polysaccharide lyase family 7 protein [Pseudomonas sp. Z18(2022)]